MDFNIIAYDSDKIQAIENKKLLRWGVQFHPEAIVETNEILYNFYLLTVL